MDMAAFQLALKRTTQYFRDSYNEMRSVVWPSRKQTISHTILVIIFSVVIALFLGSLDILFRIILERVIIR